MVQNQLVDYISSQLKAGMSQDAIKSTLIGAGWQAADVDDTMKKVAMDMKPADAVQAQAVAAKPAVATGSVAVAAKPADIIGGVNPAKTSQPVRVGDAMPSSNNTFPFSTAMGTKTDKAAMPTTTATMMGAIKTSSVEKGKSSGGGKLIMIVEIVIIVALIGLSGFLYFQNTSLSGKVDALNTQSGSVSSQVSSLTGQVQTLTQGNNALTAQVAALTATDTALASDLAFFVVPPTNSTATITATVNGTVGGVTSLYTFMTDEGVKLTIKNSSDPNTIAVLNPLIGKSAQITGTFLPGTRLFTLTQVNGTPIAVPASSPAASTTAASSTSSATPPASSTSSSTAQ